MTAILLGVGAALAFPVAALLVYRQSERLRNRRAGRRRTDRIKL